jgi:hypothetical protein
MTTPAPDSGVTAALLQMQKLAEQFGALDGREGEHYRDVSHALTGLGSSVDDLRSTVDGHGEVLESLNGFGDKLAELASAIESLLPPNPGPGHQPEPAVQWWADDLTDTDRADALARLRAWVEQIYRPHYGYLAGPLGQCWEQHPFCLVTLDWLSEQWAVLYMRPGRTASVLNSQAEFSTRLLPAAAVQMKSETSGCDHAQERQRQRAYAGWGGGR